MTGEPDDVDAMVEPVVPSRHRWLAGLLAAAPGDRVADLGCGTGSYPGRPASRRACWSGSTVSSAALDRAAEALTPVARLARVRCSSRPTSRTRCRSLPAPSTGCSATTCWRCLPDPDALVAEAVSGSCSPGGRLVLAHSDYDTLIFTSEDLQLTRRLVQAYCDTQQPWMDAVDGTIGRHLVEIAGRCGLVVEDVQADRRPRAGAFSPGELGWGYAHNIVGALQGAGWTEQASPGRMAGRAAPAGRAGGVPVQPERLRRGLWSNAPVTRARDARNSSPQGRPIRRACSRGRRASSWPSSSCSASRISCCPLRGCGRSSTARPRSPWSSPWSSAPACGGRRRRWPGTCIAVGQLLFTVGDAYSFFHEWVLEVEVPFPSIADALYLVFYPVLAAGLLLLVRERAPGRDAASLIDATIITTGIGMLSWVFLIGPVCPPARPQPDRAPGLDRLPARRRAAAGGGGPPLADGRARRRRLPAARLRPVRPAGRRHRVRPQPAQRRLADRRPDRRRLDPLLRWPSAWPPCTRRWCRCRSRPRPAPA